MALDFPSNPSNNQIYTDSTTGNRYRYDSPSASWEFSPLSILNGISNSHVLFTSNEGTFAGNTGLTFNANANTLTANTINAYSMRVTGNLYVGSNTVTITNDAVMAQSFFIMNNGAPIAVSTGAITNASYEVANAAFAHSNTTLIHSQDVYNAVNSAFGVINASFTQSNTDNVRLTSAYDSSNAGYTVANASFAAANAEFTFSNTIYAAVNSAFGVINAAFASANNVAPQIAPAFNTANAAFDMANTKLASAGGTITGDLVVQGNATFSGVTTYANTQTLLIGDNLVTLNADIPNNVAPSENSGLEINRGSSSNVSILWNEGNDRWTFTNDGSTFNQIASNVDVSTVDSRLTSAFDVANAAYTSSNADYVMSNAAFTVANAAFGVANTVTNYLPLSGGTLSNTVFIRGYTGGTAGSLMANYTKSFVIGGPYNQTYNSANAVLMLIADYSNDTGDNVYPIYVEDENNVVDFYLYAGADQTIASKRAYIAGSLGVGTTTPGYKLDVSGIINTSDQFRASGGGGDVRLNGNYGGTTAVVGTVGSTGFGIMTSNDPSRLWITSGGSVGVGTTSPSQKLHVVGTGFASSDFRSPIFYDSDNTGFYVDPASTTWGVNSAGGAVFRNIQISSSSLTDTVQNVSSGGNLWLQYGHNGPLGLCFGGGTTTAYGQLNITAPSGGWNARPALVVASNGDGYLQTRHIRGKDTSGTGVDHLYIQWDQAADVYLGRNIFSLIYYDRNDSAFYVDPNSVSRMSITNIDYLRGSRTINSSYNSSNTLLETPTGIEIDSGRFIRFTGGLAPFSLYRTSGDQPAPYGIGWGNGGESSGIFQRLASNGSSFGEMIFYTGNDGSGSFAFRRGTWEGTSFQPSGSNHYGTLLASIDWAGVFTAIGDVRSPIFYDSNDTGYYVNPNGTSNMYRLNLQNYLYVYGGTSTACEFVGGWGQYGKVVQLRTDGAGGQDGPQLWFHKGGAKYWAIGIAPYSGQNWFSFYEDGWNGAWGTERFRFDQGGALYCTNNVVAYWSDKRLKTNVKTLTNALDIVKNLRGVVFQWNETGKAIFNGNDTPETGFIAQEVQDHIPSAVRENKLGTAEDGSHYLTIDQDKIVPYLVEAIKEQQSQIDELKRQIKSN